MPAQAGSFWVRGMQEGTWLDLSRTNWPCMSPAHHPWQLRSDPAAPFPPLLPGACANLWWGQAGEPEPEEGGDQRGEGRAAAFRYKPRGCQGTRLVVLRKVTEQGQSLGPTIS